ncbi:MAG: hypothetical protein II006_03415 [Peptostreptococcaceae bacterium]|nr:hypothetical protein [Peptostreptococcaceae bacterium]
MKEENETIIKALNMYGRVPKQWELLNEIERLNNIIKYLLDNSDEANNVYENYKKEYKE